MDASKLKIAETGAIHVKDAAGDPLYDDGKPVRIVLHSPGSKAFSIVESRQTNRAVKRHNDNDGRLAVASNDERRRETAEDLAAVTVAFEGLTYGDLQGPALYEAVYNDPALGFIAQQVTKALKDWSTFQGKSGAA